MQGGTGEKRPENDDRPGKFLSAVHFIMAGSSRDKIYDQELRAKFQ